MTKKAENPIAQKRELLARRLFAFSLVLMYPMIASGLFDTIFTALYDPRTDFVAVGYPVIISGFFIIITATALLVWRNVWLPRAVVALLLVDILWGFIWIDNEAIMKIVALAIIPSMISFGSGLYCIHYQKLLCAGAVPTEKSCPS